MRTDKSTELYVSQTLPNLSGQQILSLPVKHFLSLGELKSYRAHHGTRSCSFRNPEGGFIYNRSHEMAEEKADPYLGHL